jgi:hypothetical protein
LQCLDKYSIPEQWPYSLVQIYTWKLCIFHCMPKQLDDGPFPKKEAMI